VTARQRRQLVAQSVRADGARAHGERTDGRAASSEGSGGAKPRRVSEHSNTKNTKTADTTNKQREIRKTPSLQLVMAAAIRLNDQRKR
jgi:hypothetical protein